MSWPGLDAFLDMGGDGLYVWGSYLMVAAALAWEGLVLVQRHRRAVAELQQQSAQRAFATRRYATAQQVPQRAAFSIVRHWPQH